ncbi:MAG: TetR/AcrR family transcriptional regulator [Candidatus Krumholzibacteriota bacterium]|nr:TetR/AcrR family transcriptional regulator [Candidatus Krumholzibacteriota bacterium]
MARGKSPKSSKKRERIVAAATALFARHGIRRITVEEICRTAGASKMTFYKHFANKIELLKTIWHRWLEEGYRRLDEIDAMEIPFKDKMKLLVTYKLELLPQMSGEILDDLQDGDGELLAFFEQIRGENLSRFMKFVEKAQARGDIRTMRPELFLALMNKLKELAEDGNLRAAYGDDLELIRELQEFFFFGILPAADKGNEA